MDWFIFIALIIVSVLLFILSEHSESDGEKTLISFVNFVFRVLTMLLIITKPELFEFWQKIVLIFLV